MSKYALLCGSAHEGFWQEKVNHLYNDLVSDSWSEKDIYIFPNGASEVMLEYALNNAIEQKIENIFLYICTSSPVSDSDESIWLNGEEIRKSVIEHYATLLGDRFQVIYDSDREEISDTELGYERIG